jgi:two-component system LytT family sensor kinase
MTARTFAVILVVWTVPIVMGVAQYAILAMIAPQPFTLRATLLVQTPFWWFWAAATPLVFAAGRAWTLRRGRRPLSIALHVVLALALTAAHVCVSYAATIVAGTLPASETFARFFAVGLPRLASLDFVLYAIVVAAGRALDLRVALAEQRLRAAMLETQVADARLRTLRMQLNPHFLFNTLNSVATLIRARSNDEALRVLVALGDLLRYVLRTDALEVPLADELAFLEEYLEIERVRFQDRLQVDVTADADAQLAAVPSLLLQPLVENAIRHGVSRQPGAGLIAVTARRRGDTLEVTVRDNGPGPQESPAAGLGLGLQNTRARLTELYRDRGSVTLMRHEGATVVRVVLPFRVCEAAV